MFQSNRSLALNYSMGQVVIHVNGQGECMVCRADRQGKLRPAKNWHDLERDAHAAIDGGRFLRETWECPSDLAALAQFGKGAR